MEWTKYMMSLTLGGGLLILFGKKDSGRGKWLMGLGAGAGLAAMELTVEYVLRQEVWMMIASLLKGIAFFSAIVLAGYVIEWLRMLPAEQKDVENVHPIRQWMEDYQESFLQLSRSFCMVPQPAACLDRGERVLQERLRENRMAAAGQLKEMSGILAGAMEKIYNTREDEDFKKEIEKKLRLLGVQVYKVFFYDPQKKRCQVYLTMKTRRKICVSTKKIAAILSDLMDREMMPARDSRSFVSQDKVTVLFVEGTAYNILYGIQKETRQGEPLSGDNFAVFWVPEGRFYAGLSDGMGSGLQACTQSELVLDLLEQFLESGFSEETAIRMINSSIVLQPGTPVFSTIDIVSVDLYTGVCDFRKAGAAVSFIRRENMVESIRGAGLPAGADGQISLEPYRMRMYDGDILFMVTDGVLGALPEGQEEEVLKELIWNLVPDTPNKMAKRLLEQVQAYGQGEDDMTVLVAGMWKR